MVELGERVISGGGFCFGLVFLGGVYWWEVGGALRNESHFSK